MNLTLKKMKKKNKKMNKKMMGFLMKVVRVVKISMIIKKKKTKIYPKENI